MSRLTKDLFVERSKIVHAGTDVYEYDYSKVKYVNTKTKVIIICPEHGEFLQTPEKHMLGQGCPKCSNKKLEMTNFKKYGVRRPLQSKEIHDKVINTCMERYGVPNAGGLPDVMEKRRLTCQSIYGTDYAIQSSEVRSKKDSTNIERYGGVSPFSSEVVRQKAINSVLSIYGVDNVAKNVDVHSKMVATCERVYGCASPLSNSEVQKKKLETMNVRYGSNCPICNDDIKKKAVDTLIKHFGVDNAMKNEVIKNKVLDSKRLNGTFHTSSSEEKLYICLCQLFSVDDVERQYVSKLYPYPCDFYIKSRDMYIELNGTWTHGHHWFDISDVLDNNVLDKWVQLSLESDYYKNAVHVWSERDVMKRMTARDNNLNYIVFWRNDLSDFEEWREVGCPDAQDWKCMYSWK